MSSGHMFFGKYLDRHVSLERGGFEFAMDSDLFLGLGQAQIEKEAATIAKRRSWLGHKATARKEARTRVVAYVDTQAPWHKEILSTVDLSGLPYNASNEEIEMHDCRKRSSRRKSQLRTTWQDLLTSTQP